MIVSAFIADLHAKFPHSHTNAEQVAWINEVDRDVLPDAEKTFVTARYNRVANVSNISYPSGVEYEDIESLSIDGFKYWAVDARTIHSHQRHYYEEDGKIEIRPIPTQSDPEFISGANEITFGTNTITTSGTTSFSGFNIGDILKASGSLLKPANNKYAVITAVAEKVLTFNPGAFSAQAEAAAITLQVPKIKMVYTAKTTDLVNDEAGLASELKIPNRFQPIYRWYLMAQISTVRKEFGDYENYKKLYNSAVADYIYWYLSRMGISDETAVIMDGGWGNHDTTDFDTD